MRYPTTRMCGAFPDNVLEKGVFKCQAFLSNATGNPGFFSSRTIVIKLNSNLKKIISNYIFEKLVFLNKKTYPFCLHGAGVQKKKSRPRYFFSQEAEGKSNYVRPLGKTRPECRSLPSSPKAGK